MQGEKPLYGDVVTPSGHICGYLINDDDEEKENNQDAASLSRVRQVAERMEDGTGRGRRSGRGVAAAETGPIRLYHPWQTHSVGVQAERSESPIPRKFEPNVGPAYVPFHIINREGRPVPAKYVRVKMTNDPYMYGMLNSTGEVFKGMIHAAPYSTSPTSRTSRRTTSSCSGSTTLMRHALTMRWHALGTGP